jgi:hypothetical protein
VIFLRLNGLVFERMIQVANTGTKGGEELAQLLGKAQSVYQTIIEVQQRITQITETLSQ